jgi:hypothetical protein
MAFIRVCAPAGVDVSVHYPCQKWLNTMRFSTFPFSKASSLFSIISIFVIRRDKFTELSQTNQMSRRGKSGAAPSPSKEDDDLSFLIQKASEKQARLAAHAVAEDPTPESPCDKFGPLPVSPLVTFPDRNFPVNVVQECQIFNCEIVGLN